MIHSVFSRFLRFTPSPLAEYLIRAALLLVFTCLFYQIAQRYMPYSGDGGWIADEIIAHNQIVRHSPLTSLIHLGFYNVLSLFGFTAWQSISISSAFAGALSIQLYFAIRRNPLFLLINMGSGSFLVFVGQVENYAWVNLFLLGVFWSVENYLLDRWKAWPAISFFFISALSHFLAFFYLPALFWVLWKKQSFKASEFLIPFILFLVFHIGFNLLLPGEGINFDSSRLVPWFEKTSRLHHFTFFSYPHFALKYYFHIRTSFPLVLLDWEQFQQWHGLLYIPMEWPLVLLFYRRIRSPFSQYLFLCSVTGFFWTTLWHPDLGPIDWDLFSQMGIPLHLLNALLIIDRNPLPPAKTNSLPPS